MSQYRKGYIFERKTNSYLQEKLSYHKELKFYAIESRGSKGSADIIFGLYNKKNKKRRSKIHLIMNKNFLYYMIGQGSWFLSQGLQMVLFPTILVLMLNVSPAFYGLAQVSILAPSIFLIVLGGAIADRTDTRKLLGIIHLLATLPLFLILFGLNYSFLSFQIMILYGLTTGTAQAFALPARDSLLNKVANGNIQKTVITAMLIQFICQLSGMSMGGLSD